MAIVEKLDDIGKPAWIGLMVFGFIVFWPAGLAVLAYLIWSGRMGCWKRSRGQWWHGEKRASTGNSAFDEYRAETLKRLEDEQKEFVDFLDRLRRAKDKAEFDQFMAEQRGRRPDGPAPEAPGA
ncbi:hypothetical protein GCM10017083_09280 [Thalassobaculum fulvum]|uniref:DUF2852 domain-containing protein n=1 Tax=Thalassobaculum fulvum TaxID=1633335 RepID=A0A918XPW1_9PROT|nr:DUF2852 domain-containing protein [Thalassobaculum fulvum]GHD43313.1 hypothetical protein GCM10017083_09280 [Thalassobaculum fulvum]